MEPIQLPPIDWPPRHYDTPHKESGDTNDDTKKKKQQTPQANLDDQDEQCRDMTKRRNEPGVGENIDLEA